MKHYLLYFAELNCPLSENQNDEIFLTLAQFCFDEKLENLPLGQTTNDMKNPDSTHSPTKRWIQTQNMALIFRKMGQRVCTLPTKKKYIETINF